jgi:hypothetical protein
MTYKELKDILDTFSEELLSEHIRIEDIDFLILNNDDISIIKRKLH